MLHDDLVERLKRLDEDASLIFDDDERFRLVIVGGSALILLERISRATHDVDVISIPGKLSSLLEKYDINSQVQAYINNFPYNFEDRLIPVRAGGRKIDFYTASLEDIVIAKLYATRDTDKCDIESNSVVSAIDWTLLEKLAKDEAKASALNERSYDIFEASYDDYVRRFRP